MEASGLQSMVGRLAGTCWRRRVQIQYNFQFLRAFLYFLSPSSILHPLTRYVVTLKFKKYIYRFFCNINISWILSWCRIFPSNSESLCQVWGRPGGKHSPCCCGSRGLTLSPPSAGPAPKWPSRTRTWKIPFVIQLGCSLRLNKCSVLFLVLKLGHCHKGLVVDLLSEKIKYTELDQDRRGGYGIAVLVCVRPWVSWSVNVFF